MRETIENAELSLGLQLDEIQEICERFLSENKFTNCEKQKDQIEENGNSSELFEIGSFDIRPASDGPAGFLGRHNFMNVEILMKNKNLGKQELAFFTKSAPLEASRLEYLEEFGVFKKEILVYRKVLPKIEKIFPDIAPKCFFANKNILVFENLSHLGYRMGAKRDGLLTYEHLKRALKSLAALHAGSFCLENKTGKNFRKLFPEAVVENSYPLNVPESHLRLQNFNQANEVFKAMVATMPRYQKDLAFITSEMPKKMKAIFELSQESKKYRNVFSHGDLWANNIMFSYSKFGGIPIEARLVDFQLARYAPPMLDLITILTIPTSRKFREQHLLELLNDYYRFLKEFLKFENLDIEDILPEKEFYESFEEFRICGLIESCLFSHLTVLPTEAATNLTSSTDGFNDFFNRKRIDICMKAFHTDKIYRERLTDMLEDFVDSFVLYK